MWREEDTGLGNFCDLIPFSNFVMITQREMTMELESYIPRKRKRQARENESQEGHHERIRCHGSGQAPEPCEPH